MEQNKPKKNSGPCIQDLVMQDLKERKKIGIERYGVALQPFNTRNSVQDAYEEAMDLTQYLKQMQIEREKMIQHLKQYAKILDQELNWSNEYFEVKDFLESIGES